MTVQEIIAILEEFAPREYACTWDNVGLMAGRKNAEVTHVYVALDADDFAVEEAVSLGCDMLLTHHPLLFSPIKKINEESIQGRRLLTLIENHIAYYAMHTSFDSAPGGMADLAAARLGLTKVRVMEETMAPAGLGCVGRFPEPIRMDQLCQKIKGAFSLPFLTLYGGEEEQEIRTLAILPGSGRGEIELARSLGADAYLTGDLTYHDGIDAMAEKFPVIDAGHYGLEWIFIPFMVDFLREKLPQSIRISGAPLRHPEKMI